MKLYKVVQNCTKLYKVVQNCTKLYKVVQNCTKLYKVVQDFMASCRFRHAVDFVDQCKTNFRKTKDSSEYCEWSDTVTIKLDASDHSDDEYKNKFGGNFLDEETLIIGDEMNNVLMVYQDEDKVVTKNITSLIHVLSKLRLTSKCIVHKKMEPSRAPPHIKVNLTFIQNNVQNANTIQNATTIQNNFNNLSISSTDIDTAQSYLETYFKRGGICPLKKLSRHPEWNKAYLAKIETKKMNICKSCHQRWLKGCCAEYSRNNRTIWVMVVGWHE